MKRQIFIKILDSFLKYIKVSYLRDINLFLRNLIKINRGIANLFLLFIVYFLISCGSNFDHNLEQKKFKEQNQKSTLLQEYSSMISRNGSSFPH